MIFVSRYWLRPKSLVVAIILCVYLVQMCVNSSSVERCRQNSSDARLVNNGYEGLVVWIGDEVIEDYNLIKDLKKLLTATSEKMFHVTRRRAYIRQVSVLLPRSWGKPPSDMEESMKAEKYPTTQSKGDFHLRDRTPKSNNDRAPWLLGDSEALVERPYVIKPTPCGFSGRYLRLTPEFVRFGENAANEIGAPDKIMIREWAKLRWGVYDEIPKPDPGVNFYTHTDLEVHPIACSMAIKGKIINSTDPKRSCSPADAENEPSCEFVPNKSMPGQGAPRKLGESVQNSYASLMYRSDLDYVDHFCDTEEESGEAIPLEQQHNFEAPTVHNLHCQSKSVWEVMRGHSDFANGENPSRDESFIPPPLQFNLLQVPDRRIVLVLDISTSMDLFNRLKLMRQAASQFIDTVPVSTWVGIVVFAGKADQKSELIEIENEDSRDNLKKRLPNFVVAGTSIGSGIYSALKVLNSSGPPHMRNSGGTMLLITDGKEHNSPKINDTLQEVLDSSVTVNTIAFGPQVTIELEYLAEITGGKSYFASSGEFSSDNELREAFLATIENEKDGVVVVSSQAIKIRANDTNEYNFTIDPSIGMDTRITIMYSESVPPMVGIESPLGDVKWQDDEYGFSNITAEFKTDPKFLTISIQFYGYMEPGTWKILLMNTRKTEDMILQISILSHAREEEETLVLSPALLCRIIEFTGVERIVIYAHLSVGELAIMDASVIAAVTRPLSITGMVDTAYVSLMDDGLGADVIADDGIYSGYFTSFTLEGRYNVKVFARNGDGLARTEPSYILGIGPRNEKPAVVDVRYLLRDNTENKNEGVKSRKRRDASPGFLPLFERSSSGAGAFTVSGITAMVCPPGYIHFQDSCFKFVRASLLSNMEASIVCENEGGYLAHVNSNQELKYLLDMVAEWDAWFGGVDKAFLESDDLSVELVTTRPRRGSEDEDLTALAQLFSSGFLNEDLLNTISTFEPDFEGLSRKEINKIIRSLGIQSISDIQPLKEQKLFNQQNPEVVETTIAGARKRRQVMQPAPPAFGGILFPDTTNTVILTTDATISENVTLAMAKKQPEKYDFANSGEPDPGCSWFQDRKIVKTTGQRCTRNKAFICERPKFDLVPPSRIVNLRAKVIKDNGLVNVTWSAPGDDYTAGKATKYEMRTLRTRKARSMLLREFEAGEILTQEALVEGNFISPNEPGRREALRINLTKISGCPSHAALDIILLLPQRFVSKKSMLRSQRDAGVEMFRTLFSLFIISTYEVQVSIVSVNNRTGTIILQDASSFDAVMNAFSKESDLNNVVGQAKEQDLDRITTELSREGRDGVPKIFFSLLDEEAFGDAQPLTKINDAFSIVVGIDLSDKRTEVRAMTSDPTCRNAIFVESWQELNSTADAIANQFCYARETEYQALGIVAIDDQGLRGATSNIVPFVIHNPREVVSCVPEPTPVTEAMVAGIDAATVGLAVGIPFGVLIAVVGVIMLFGQFKKYRKKKLEREKRKQEEAKLEAAETARSQRLKQKRFTGVRSNMLGLLQNVRQNPNARLKTNKTAPLTQPPV